MLHALSSASLGQEETANATMSGEARNDSGIVYKWVVSWIKAAATAAPARAEALLQEHLRYKIFLLSQKGIKSLLNKKCAVLAVVYFVISIKEN